MREPEFLSIFPAESSAAYLLLWGSILLLCLCAVLFGALAVWLRVRNERTAKRWQEMETRWEPPLMEVLAGTASPESLWRHVEPGQQLYFVDFLLRYARRTRGSTRDRVAQLARPYLAPLVERSRSPEVERRARAIETLAQLGYGDHTEIIVQALADGSPLVAMVAARAVAREGDARHAPAVIHHLPRLQSWSSRQVASTLTSLGAGAVPALRAALADRTQPAAVRAVVADALRGLYDPGAADLAVQLLDGETDRELLAALLRLLQESGRAEHAATVRPFCESADPLLQALALSALATLGDARDVPFFRAGMDAPSTWVAIHAARAFRNTGHAHVLVDLIEAGHPRAALARQALMEGR